MSALAAVDLDSLSRDDLVKVLQRDRFVKEQLSYRVASLTAENVELLGLVQELQAALMAAERTESAEREGS